jgi:uncharacterized protein (DUF983 family)
MEAMREMLINVLTKLLHWLKSKDVRECSACGAKIKKGDAWFLDFSDPKEDGSYYAIHLCAKCEAQYQEEKYDDGAVL